ncbi:uncharacterized protein BBA_08971 [Beauveria bassiana ARSEF 2860]|uniref:Uncharacterized protein n=1 Tax=Beauveria bassiana (strain ARSEF 2860) TaxID=655819 RepID=J4UGL8_BEAB2|nr:uncharacterized protein BBA_08971 [Beauveria bassiana ARSEF 2860]EJP62047.1 hypothetical protein BBA_08971 [Beauveria bassiana ARSEF 2860]
MFSCLLEDIEPADRKLWPPAVCDTLSKLAEEELRECRNLQKLVSELSQPLQATDCGSQDLRPPAGFMLIKYRDEAYVYGCARSKCSEVTSAISDSRLEQRTMEIRTSQRIWDHSLYGYAVPEG